MPSYRYKLPSGQEVQIGDPTINREILKGATFISGPGADPLASTPSSNQPSISRTVDPSADAAQSFLGTFRQPETPDQIAERKRQQSADLISSIEKNTQNEIDAAKTRGAERVSMDNAVSVLSGLMGSTEAVRSRNKVNDANAKEIQAINYKKALQLAQLYTQISSDAETEARQQLTDATKSAEDILARREKSQASAISTLTSIAKTGLIDFDKFKNDPNNAKVYQYALDSAGGSEDALAAIFALNRPAETVIDKKWIGNKLVQVFRNPVTGETKSEVVDLGIDIPKEYSQEVDLGDRVMLIPKDYDPAKDQPIFISKGLTPSQQSGDGLLKETAGERNALGFYVRGKDALDTIGTVESKVTDTLGKQGALQFFPNLFQSSDMQIYRQLQRQFTEARLRKESGAAIPQAEYDTDAKTYFAQPGDTKETLARKQAAREKVLESLRISAGNAYKNYAADPGNAKSEEPSTDPESAPIGATVVINGVQYRKDGEDAYTEL